MLHKQPRTNIPSISQIASEKSEIIFAILPLRDLINRKLQIGVRCCANTVPGTYVTGWLFLVFSLGVASYQPRLQRTKKKSKNQPPLMFAWIPLNNFFLHLFWSLTTSKNENLKANCWECKKKQISIAGISKRIKVFLSVCIVFSFFVYFIAH